MHALEEFERLVAAVVRRFFAQTLRPLPAEADIARFAAQLGRLVAERGLPAPLAAGELGTPGGLADSACAPLVARALEGTDEAVFADVAKQLVKACFYPEFAVCRESYRECTRDGTCRRQELVRVRSRIAGTHCVDCPHWLGFEAEEHAAFLARAWQTGPQEFHAHRAEFLPEDFRALRRWLHRAARSGLATT